MNINPFNTFGWHRFEYDRHSSKAVDLREKAEKHDEAAMEHLAWLMQEEKNQQRFLEDLAGEEAKAQEVIRAITEVKTRKPGNKTNGGARKRTPAKTTTVKRTTRVATAKAA